MCGIAGFVGTPDRNLLEKMRAGIAHRGPDQRGDFESSRCSFAHARLSIIDLSEAGRQPMSTADGRFTVAYNGEIYNYQDLRKKYREEGWKFQSETDTECFLASAALHGLSDLADFHGMFAFAIWDRDERVCYLGRDRLGIKPLYHANVRSRFLIASEIPAILSASDSWNINVSARASYLALGYVPGFQTIAEGIMSLPPGRLFTYRDGTLLERFRFDAGEAIRLPSSRAEAADMLRETLDRTVARQLVSDREVGCFLSGGVDSSAVLSSVRIAKPGIRMKTFTTRFRHHTDDPKFNHDAHLAKRTAEMYECDHHEIEVGPEDVMREAERIAARLGQPHGNHSVVALDAVARLASASVPVVVGGDGGDELFGGYERYRLYARTAWMMRSLMVWKSIGFFSRLHSKYEQWEDFARAPDDIGRFIAMHATPSRLQRRLYGEAADPASPRRAIADVETDIENIHDSVLRFMVFDRAVWLRDDAFVRADRLSMHYGLELRAPITDDAMLDFSRAIPRDWLVTSRETKSLWREAVKDRCLPDVISGAKRGWFPPTAKWMRAELHDWTRDILEEAIKDHSWMSGQDIRRAFLNHCEGRGYALNEIWNIVGYQLWWRAYRSYFV